jgi:hypothetical protein
MVKLVSAIRLIAIMALLVACGTLAVPTSVALTPTSPVPETTPAPMIMADTFFTGCAYLDTNGNGTVDDGDAPIAGADYVVTLSQGAGFGSHTFERDGCATVVVPSALPESAWPVVVEMALPAPLSYVAVGEASFTLTYPDTRADFLFSP